MVFGKKEKKIALRLLNKAKYSFINVNLHRKEDQPFEVVKILTMYIMETSRVIVHQPVEAACIVFNMDNFTLKNMVHVLTKKQKVILTPFHLGF